MSKAGEGEAIHAEVLSASGSQASVNTSAHGTDSDISAGTPPTALHVAANPTTTMMTAKLTLLAMINNTLERKVW
jgi:hypothetical protein